MDAARFPMDSGHQKTNLENSSTVARERSEYAPKSLPNRLADPNLGDEVQFYLGMLQNLDRWS